MEPTIFSQIKAMFRSLSGVLKKQNAEVDRRFVEYDEVVSERLTKKLDAHDPVASGSFSLGRAPKTIVGEGSFAVGDGAEASGERSFAHGTGAVASGYGSVALCGSKATNWYAFAHGGAVASGSGSVAFGTNAKATGNESFAVHGAQADGYSSFAVTPGAEASGDYSHAIGCNAVAKGPYSGAYGYFTTAYGRSTHVFGEFNARFGVPSSKERGDYTLIVGNGTSDTARSNAHTLDWKGTGWFAGGLKIGGTWQGDSDAVDVLTTADVSPVATSGSWNDLGDKPFGDGDNQWMYVVECNIASATQADGGRYTTSVDMSFNPTPGSKYRIEVKDGLWGYDILSHECVCENENNPAIMASFYRLGVSADPVSMRKVVIAGQENTTWDFEFQNAVSSNGYKVRIYEAVPTIIPLDEKYIPDTIARATDIPTVSDIIAELPIYNGEVEEV